MFDFLVNRNPPTFALSLAHERNLFLDQLAEFALSLLFWEKFLVLFPFLFLVLPPCKYHLVSCFLVFLFFFTLSRPRFRLLGREGGAEGGREGLGGGVEDR